MSMHDSKENEEKTTTTTTAGSNEKTFYELNNTRLCVNDSCTIVISNTRVAL